MLQNLIEAFQFNWHALFTSLSGLLCLGLGIFVLWNNPRSAVHQSFSFFTLNATVWIVPYGAISFFSTNVNSFPFVVASHFGIPFIPVTTFLFVSNLIGKPLSKRLVWGGYLWSVSVLLWFLFTNGRISIPIYRQWGRFTSWPFNFEGILNALYLMIPFACYSLASFRILFQAYRFKPSRQYRTILVAFFIAYTGSIDFLAALGTRIYPFGYLSLTAFTCIVAYSIVRHHAFNIRIVIKRVTLAVAIYLVLLSIVIPVSLPLMKWGMYSRNWDPVVSVLVLSCVIGVVLSLGPIIFTYIVRKNYWLRGHVTQGLAHELKSPLGTIQSAADLALDFLVNPEKNEKSVEYIEMIQRNADRMDSYVKDLLLVAKLSHEIELEQQDVNVAEILREAVADIDVVAMKKGIGLRLLSPETVMIQLDRSKVEQVISNLLSNSVKFTKEGEIIVELLDKVFDIEICVRDSGRGIEAKNLKRIFERFYQVDKGVRGSGLGLAIAKAWVEAHGGKIWAQSEGLGKGSEFRVVLPK